LNVSGPRKWGPTGYNQPGGAPPPPPPEKPAPTSEPPSYNQAAKPAFGSSQAAKAAPEPPAMTEKQKMAAALFGGLTGTTTAAPKPASAVKAVPTPAPEPAAPAAPAAEKVKEPPPASPTDMMDLLDLDGGADATPDGLSQPTSAPPPPPPPSGGSDMLLDMSDEGLTAPAAVPPPPAAVLPGAMAPQAPSIAPVMQMPVPQPLLGPLPVTTAQLGAMWGQLPAEQKLQLQTSILNCQELMQRLSTSLNVHPVEIIGMEGIAAGRVLPGNDPCFLHGKLAPPRLEMLVRCRDPGVGQRVAELCMRSLV